MGLVNRSGILLTIGVLLASWMGVANAAPLPRVAMVSLAAPADQMRAFEEGLLARGWIHGTNMILEHRTAHGRGDDLVPVAIDVVSLSPSVIVAVGTKAAKAAQDATTEIPIVAVTGDMIAAGLVKNVNQPEGNITGFSFFNTNLATKRLELLLEINPSLLHLKILMYARRTRTQEQALSMMREFLDREGIDAEIVAVEQVQDLETLIGSMSPSVDTSLFVMPSPQLDAQATEIGRLIARHGIIAMLPWKQYVEAGGLVSYSADIVAIWRQAGGYVDRILRGADPRDLPIVQPTSFELVVNVGSAKAMGLALPASILLRADRIID